MNKFTLIVLAMIASADTITPVIAAPPATAIAIVRTADLDLGTAAGQRTLDHRLTIAIVEACGAASDVDLQGQNAVRACRVETSASVGAERDRLIEIASRGQDFTLAAR